MPLIFVYEAGKWKKELWPDETNPSCCSGKSTHRTICLIRLVQMMILPKWHVVGIELVIVVKSNTMSRQFPFSTWFKHRLTLNHSVLTRHVRLQIQSKLDDTSNKTSQEQMLAMNVCYIILYCNLGNFCAVQPGA